jgi:hypothetical protein
MRESNQPVSIGLGNQPLPSTTQARKKANAIEDRNQKYVRLIDSPELNLTPFQRDILRGRWLDQMDWFSRKAGFYQQWFYWVRLITIIFSVLAPVFISFGSMRGDRLNDQQLAAIVNVIAANPSTPQVSPSPAVAGAPDQLASPAAPSPAVTSSAALDGKPPISEAISEAISANKSEQLLSNIAFHFGLFLSQVVAILAAVEQFFKFGDRWRHYRRTAEALKSHGWQFFQLGGAYISYAKKGGHQAAFPVFVAQVEEIIQSDVEGFVSQIAVQKQLDKQESDLEASNPSFEKSRNADGT